MWPVNFSLRKMQDELIVHLKCFHPLKRQHSFNFIPTELSTRPHLYTMSCTSDLCHLAIPLLINPVLRGCLLFDYDKQVGCLINCSIRIFTATKSIALTTVYWYPFNISWTSRLTLYAFNENFNNDSASEKCRSYWNTLLKVLDKST